MDKLKMHSPDLTEGNIAKIRDLFPNCVTEAPMRTASCAWQLILISSNRNYQTAL